MSKFYDSVELSVPLKAEYVIVARLAASGIATRMGFDIEKIEDIKVSIAEVCNKLVELREDHPINCLITFNVHHDMLEIIFDSEDKSLNCMFEDQKDEMGLLILKSLMDNVQFCDDNSYLLSMSMLTEGNS